jgi:hypothetical protein
MGGLFAYSIAAHPAWLTADGEHERIFWAFDWFLRQAGIASGCFSPPPSCSPSRSEVTQPAVTQPAGIAEGTHRCLLRGVPWGITANFPTDNPEEFEVNHGCEARRTWPLKEIGPNLIAEMAAWFQGIHSGAKEPVMPAWFQAHERYRAERRQAGELLPPLFAQPYPYENHPLAPAWRREHEPRREHERKLAEELQSVRILRQMRILRRNQQRIAPPQMDAPSQELKVKVPDCFQVCDFAPL